MSAETEHPLLYKYRSWTDPYHQNALINNEIYLASPADFNDPFDCRITPNFIDRSEQELEDYVKRTMNNQASQLRKVQDPTQRINDFRNRVKKKFEFQKESDELHFKKQNECYGILSLSTTWKSILMWSHYANSHTGFCIGYDSHKLVNTSKLGKGGPINYGVEFPDVNSTNSTYEENFEQNSFRETHSKSQEWEYENEYRLMTLKPNGFQKKDRIIRLPDDVINEVTLGIQISSKSKDEIVNICKERDVDVYQAFPVQRRFEIDRNKVF